MLKQASALDGSCHFTHVPDPSGIMNLLQSGGRD